VAIEGKLGKFEPQNVVGHRVDPKQALPCVTTHFEPLCVKIHPRVTSVGKSGKNINKKEEALYFTFSPDAPLRPTGTNFGLRVCLVDTINCAKFYRNPLIGLVSVRGRILTIRIGLRII